MKQPLHSNVELVLQACSRNKSPGDKFTTLSLLSFLGMRVPPFGKVEDLCKNHDRADWCVVWLPGESRLMTLNDAYNKWATNLASMYIGQPAKAVSTRHIQIGDTAFLVDYTAFAPGGWRAGRGKASLRSIISNHYHPSIKLPVFAMDLVGSYVVGFDASPGIRGTGIDEVLPHKEAVALVKKAITHFERNS